MRIAVPLPVACVVLIKVAKESDCERRGEASSSTFIQHCALRARFRVPSAGGARALSVPHRTQAGGAHIDHRDIPHSCLVHMVRVDMSPLRQPPRRRPRDPPPRSPRARAQFFEFESMTTRDTASNTPHTQEKITHNTTRACDTLYTRDAVAACCVGSESLHGRGHSGANRWPMGAVAAAAAGLAARGA